VFAGIVFLDSALVGRGRLPEYTRIFRDPHGRSDTECQNPAAAPLRRSVSTPRLLWAGSMVRRPGLLLPAPFGGLPVSAAIRVEAIEEVHHRVDDVGVALGQSR
jgi:hypothetical protein